MKSWTVFPHLFSIICTPEPCQSGSGMQTSPSIPSSLYNTQTSPHTPSLLCATRSIHKIVDHLSHHRRLHYQLCLLARGTTTYFLSLITYRILELRAPNTLMCARARVRLLLGSQFRRRTWRVVDGSTCSTVGSLDALDARRRSRDQIPEVA